MKRRLLPLLILLILILHSCAPVEPVEITVLKSIIERDFNQNPTLTGLIPIKMYCKYDYDGIINEYAKVNSPPHRAEPPPNPKLHHHQSNINCTLFHQLIQNSFIDEATYNRLSVAVKSVEGKSYEIRGTNILQLSAQEVHKKNDIDAYQVFAYPVMTKNHLIVYLNSYSGLIHREILGSLGSGMFYIYKKNKTEWTLIYKLQTWIT